MVNNTQEKFNQFLIAENANNNWLTPNPLNNSGQSSTLDQLARQNSLLMMMERFYDQ